MDEIAAVGPSGGSGVRPHLSEGGRRMPGWGYGVICVLMLVGLGCVEHGMGRLAVSASGTFRLWVSGTDGPETSQQLFDVYSFSHVLHGILFFGGLWWVGRRLPVGVRLLMCVGIEVGWEILENSPLVIARYRQTAALGYEGDTILNSLSDVCCCMLGFWIARKVPMWVSVGIIVVVEVTLLVWVRDNLTLNVIMLLHPFEGIKRWQLGG